MINKKILILGPSGIGKIYLREIIKLGYKNIAILGKKNQKQRLINIILKKKSEIYLKYLSNFKEAKNYKPDISLICTPFFSHYNHIIKISKFCNNIIVEKPFIRFKKNSLNKNLLNTARSLLEIKKVNIIMNLPFIYLAKELKKQKIVKKKINKFNFNYYTKGKLEYQNIAIDLLPHAISFILFFKNENYKNLKIINLKKKKNYWNCKIILNKCLCLFKFIQDKNKNNSYLSFKINDIFFKRYQIETNEDMKVNFKINKRQIINVKNPMSESIKNSLKNLNSKKNIDENKKIILDIVDISNTLTNKSE